MKPAVISGVIVLVLAARFGYGSIYLEGQKEVQRIGAQRKELEELHALRAGVAAALDAAERLRKPFQQKIEPDRLVEEVDRLAKKAGVKLSRIGPEPAREVNGFRYLAVSLQVTCSYHELGHFLSEIEGSDIFIRVDELDVSRVGDGQGLAAAKVGLSTLYVPPLLDVPTQKAKSG